MRLSPEEVQSTQYLEAFTANRVIQLDKNPGMRPIAVGQALRRVVGKSSYDAVQKRCYKSCRIFAT